MTQQETGDRRQEARAPAGGWCRCHLGKVSAHDAKVEAIEEEVGPELRDVMLAVHEDVREAEEVQHDRSVCRTDNR